MSEIRVRFAPSPTGYLHVGGARTALFNWLFARKRGATFILRIEDTDRERSSEAMVGYILDGMRWLGLDWDEGPYFQGERVEAHRACARRLLESGHAYRCFCSMEKLDAARQKSIAAKESGAIRCPCRALDPADAARRAASEPHVVRFRTPENETVAFEDVVYKATSKATNDIEDFVLLRSDGSPTYHLSVVADDADMRITHVVRGQDHLSNTPKQILLHRALGSAVPVFGHLPLLLAPNKAKLSKRKHGEVVSLSFYRDRGFVADAFVNFLALLGWSPGGDRERLSRAELIELFDLSRVNLSNAVFNFVEGDERAWTDPKAIALNAEYIGTMEMESLLPLVRPFLERAGLWSGEYEGARAAWYRRTIELLRERCRTLADFAERGRPYYADEFTMEEKALEKNLRAKKDEIAGALGALADRMAAVEEWTAASIEPIVRAFAEEKGVKIGTLMNAARAALTGTAVGPGIFEVFEIVGPERSAARLRAAEAML
ncbi:MAG: glutamate--tRNA ligase [Candidatus Latescibacterota bacterium]|nr:MAG: glutamate--tRNA ligase [Candidatus Latescibacterota bacterium]